MEYLNNISDPFLRDWMIIISLCAVGFFIFLRWSIGFVSEVRQKANTRHDEEISRVEKYLHEEVERIRQENAKLHTDNRTYLTESIKLTNDLSMLKIKVRDLISRIRYLEGLLQRNNVGFTPVESDYDV